MPKIELLCTFVTSTRSPQMWFAADVPSVSKTRKVCECTKSSIVVTPLTRQVHLLSWLMLQQHNEKHKEKRKISSLKKSINFFTNTKGKHFVYIKTKKIHLHFCSVSYKPMTTINDEFEIKLIYTVHSVSEIIYLVQRLNFDEISQNI